jgi:cell division protease FtsH
VGVAVVFPAGKEEILVNSTVKTIMFWVFILICLMLLVGRGGEKHQHGQGPRSTATPICWTRSNGTGAGRHHPGHRAARPPEGRPRAVQRGPVRAAGRVWFFMLRQMQSGGNKALSFGKSRARLLSMQQKKVTFKDVAGVDEAKEELKEIIEYLREPQKFQKLGGRIPKGVLLVGPPGTGKTLLARAVAGEANVPFFSISGSDFVEMFVGVGASRVRDLFEQGKKNAPCIIFIDEIDAVGPPSRRGPGRRTRRARADAEPVAGRDGRLRVERRRDPGGGHQPARRARSRAAAARPLRPPRGCGPARRSRPRRDSARARQEGSRLRRHDLNVLARGTPGFSGADLANMVNEAALNAARMNRKQVTMYDFELAKDKVLMGAERKSMLLTDEEKRVTAYHEAGHALVSFKREHSDPMHKVTIIPRGMALGVTMHLPGDRTTTPANTSRRGWPCLRRTRGRGDLPQPDVDRRGQRH